MKIIFLTKLVLALNLIAIPLFAGGSSGGGGVRVGAYIMDGGSQVGSLTGYDRIDNNSQGILSVAGAEANGGNSVGTIKLVGGAEANGGSCGGGVLVEYRSIKNGGHEV